MAARGKGVWYIAHSLEGAGHTGPSVVVRAGHLEEGVTLDRVWL
jgi:hypothetical protein